MNRGGSPLIAFFKYLTLIVGVLAALVPITVVLFTSLKTPDENAHTSALVAPDNWLNFVNYKRAIVEGHMLTGFINTLIILVISLAGAILFATMISYILDRFNFRGKKLMLNMFVLAVLMPGVIMQVSIFQIINHLGLFNTRASAIVLYVGTDIIAVYIFLQFLRTISTELDESAMLDGASYLTIFFRIILPLLRPAIATVVILKGTGIYNDFYIPFLYMPKEGLNVMSTALYKFKGPYVSQWEVICAAIIVCIIPTLIAFLALQKHIYNGFTQGSVK
ncbi:MAG: carbohydrate ABC transporter permease [Paenibacillaceae bacterium]